MRHQDGFQVAAFTACTTNVAEANPKTAQIPTLWQRFLDTFASDQGEIYSVYTSYTGDQNGEYTVGVGLKAEAAPPGIPGMKLLTVPAADYLAYAANGQPPQGVVAAWQKVWNDFQPERGGLRRTFGADYELHTGPGSATVYIAVKSTDS